MKQRAGNVKQNLWMVAIVAALLLPSLAFAEEPLFTVGLGFEYASSKYGTPFRTDSIYVPLTVGIYPTERLDFSLEIPYVYQSSSAVVAGMFRGGQMQTMRVLAASPMGVGPGMGMTSASAADVQKSQSGMGDIVARGGYILITEGDYLPKVRPFVSVKFPTADKNRFLGTGEFDEGFGVELSKWISDWYSYGEVGYVIQGKSSVVSVKNYVEYSVGEGYQVTDKFLPMLILKGETPPAEGSTALLEARLKLKYQATKKIAIAGYLAKGITTASPDYGAGVAAYFDF